MCFYEVKLNKYGHLGGLWRLTLWDALLPFQEKQKWENLFIWTMKRGMRRSRDIKDSTPCQFPGFENYYSYVRCYYWGRGVMCILDFSVLFFHECLFQNKSLMKGGAHISWHLNNNTAQRTLMAIRRGVPEKGASLNVTVTSKSDDRRFCAFAAT